MSDTWARRAPWLGIAIFVLVALSLVIGGEPPDVDASPKEIADFWDDSKQLFSAALGGLAAVLFVFFAAHLKWRMRVAESFSNLILVGGAIFAVGIGLFAAVSFTLADLADTSADTPIDPGALQALNAANSDFFFPAIIGLAVFFFSTALAILSTGALPRWWGWVTLVLAVCSIAGPAGQVAFLAALPWVLVCSILLLVRPEDSAAGASHQENPVGQ